VAHVLPPSAAPRLVIDIGVAGRPSSSSAAARAANDSNP
jgi:hypothetical protein